MGSADRADGARRFRRQDLVRPRPPRMLPRAGCQRHGLAGLRGNVATQLSDRVGRPGISRPVLSRDVYRPRGGAARHRAVEAGRRARRGRRGMRLRRRRDARPGDRAAAVQRAWAAARRAARHAGQLGRENSMRSPRRTAQTASALMVGLALVSAMAVFGASLSESATSSVDQAISADLLVSVNGSGQLSDSVPAAVAAVPGVTATNTVYRNQFEFQSTLATLTGVTTAEPGRHRDPADDGGLQPPPSPRANCSSTPRPRRRITCPSGTRCRCGSRTRGRPPSRSAGSTSPTR